jgi:hypothetical protein
MQIYYTPWQFSRGNMMKVLKLTALFVGVFMLLGCVGEKQSKRKEMQDREIILISNSYPKEICLSQELADALYTQTGLTNTLTSSTENGVNCAYFSRTEKSCVKFSFTDKYADACVIAADRVPDRQNGQINAKAVADMMIGLIGE